MPQIAYFLDPENLMLLGRVPSEVSFDWVYLPPGMFTVLLGYLAATILARGLNATGLSQYFWRPEIGFVAFWVIFSCLIGLFMLPP